MPSEGEFAGRVALVTGAAGAAIGSTTCRTLASYGAGIVVLDNHHRRTHETVEALRGTYDVPVMAAVADIADRQVMAGTMDRVYSEMGSVDILVNSAAINVQGSIFDYRPEDWDRVIAVDLTAAWWLIRRTIGAMRDQRWGRIVNVTSVAAYLGGNGREGPYSAAKAGLQEVTRGVAIEGGPHNIRVNAVAPGLVRSKWVDAQFEHYESFREQTPLRRHAEPEDVSRTIAFLCSDESAHITGQVINVSGGWYLTP
ncbi:SDR family NAD(P)-dependent oxidoreductase [Candidatus Poriferisocius sp.]|uniref:SDR family NAD(P)-dependent oxidoreductase n=1 Tax=Candidatus Poriferisocius sp. TaxID=3101276 RepID=UPI003B0126EB